MKALSTANITTLTLSNQGMWAPANLASGSLMGEHKGRGSLQGRLQALRQDCLAQYGCEWQPLQQPADQAAQM